MGYSISYSFAKSNFLLSLRLAFPNPAVYNVPLGLTTFLVYNLESSSSSIIT